MVKSVVEMATRVLHLRVRAVFIWYLYSFVAFLEVFVYKKDSDCFVYPE
jgi:hypothetical protein